MPDATLLRPALLGLSLFAAACSSTPRENIGGGGGGGSGTNPDASSSDVPGNNGTNDAGTPDSGEMLPANGPDTDILFVIDNSASMEVSQQRLTSAAVGLVAALEGRVSYQVAVVTTDLSSGGPMGMERAGKRLSSFKSSEPFTLTSIDDAACTTIPIQHGCFRGPGQKIVTSDMDRATAIATLRANMDVGTCGSGTESGLSALRRALDNATAGGCNAGFLRDGARLLVIFMSDENDEESGQRPSIQEHVAAITQKPAELIRVASIVGIRNGMPENCNLQGECGQQCMRRPNLGSETMGCIQTPGLCAAGEYCDRDRDACLNEDLQFFDAFCHWCSFYNAPDCCTALSGERYFEFTQGMEDKILAASPNLSKTNCTPAPGTASACHVASICQDELGNTLIDFARSMIFDGAAP